MSADLASLYIKIDSSGVVTASRELETLKGKSLNVEKATASMESAIQKTIGVMKQLAVVAGVALGVQQIVNYTREAIQLAARVETLGVVLKVVGQNAGYSAKEMEAAVASVKKMGITTEIANDAVIKITQSQIKVADSAKLARIAQDAAVIGNINSSEAFQRMINGIRSGEIEILKTIGLNVNFEQGYAKMAQSLGKSRESLTGQEKAQARANVVMEEGIKIQGAYEASLGTAGKQMLSMARFTEELKLGYGQLFGGTLTSAVEGVTTILKSMNQYLDDMRKNGVLQEMTDIVSTTLKTAWISIKDLILTVWNIIKPFGPMISESLPVLVLIAKGWGYILAAIKPIGSFISESITMTYNLAKVVGNALVYLGALATGQTEVAAVAKAEMIKNYSAMEAGSKRMGDIIFNQIEKSIISYEKEAATAITHTKQKTQAELDAEEKISKMKADAAKAAALLREKEQGETKAAADKRIAATKQITEEIRKASIDIEGFNQTSYEKEMLRIDSEEEKWRKAKVSEKTIAEWKSLEIQKAEQKELEQQIKNAKAYQEYIDKRDKSIQKGAKETAAEVIKIDKDKLKAERDIYKDLRGYEGDFYEASVKLINKQAKEYKDLGVDRVAIEKWVAEETRKAEIKKLEHLDKFFDGVKAGYLKMKQDAMTFAQAGEAIFKSFATNSQSTMSSVLFDGLKGQWKSASDYFTSFTDSMLKTLTDTVSRMIVETATEKIVLKFGASWTEGASSVLGAIGKVLGYATDWFFSKDTMSTSGLAGGDIYQIANGGFVPGYAMGGNSYANDTVRALLSPGEYVVDRERIQAIAGQGQHGDTMLAHINPVEAQLLKTLGGAGTINPRTGLPQFYTASDWQSSFSAADLEFIDRWLEAQKGEWEGRKLGTSPYAQGLNAYKQSFAKPEYIYDDGGGVVSVNTIYPGYNPNNYIPSAYILDAQKQYEDLRDKLWSEAKNVAWYKVPTTNLEDHPEGYALAREGGSPVPYQESGTFWNNNFGILNPLLKIIGTMVGGVYGGPAGAAFGNLIAGLPEGNVSLSNFGSAAAAGIAYGIAQGGNMTATGKLPSMEEIAKSTATGYGKSLAFSTILKLLSPSGNGKLAITYGGADDNGLLSNLYKTMSGMTGTNKFAFSAADGGVFSGPDSGYNGLLHGTEAVIPLSDGRSIPVKGGGFDSHELLEEVKALRAEIKAGNIQNAKNTGKMAKILSRFDNDGLPAERIT